jgi:hypothetical protein
LVDKGDRTGCPIGLERIASVSVPIQKASATMIPKPRMPEMAIAPTIAFGTAVDALDVSSLMCTAESYDLE